MYILSIFYMYSICYNKVAKTVLKISHIKIIFLSKFYQKYYLTRI